MDALQYAEERGAQTVAVLRQAYDDLHERSYKLVMALLAGGGAAGVFVLGKIEATPSSVYAWAPIGALALSWFGIAGVLLWTGATTRGLSPGTSPGELMRVYDETIGLGTSTEGALQATRNAEIRLQDKRIATLSRHCINRARALNLAYKQAAICSPLVPIITVLACVAVRWAVNVS